MTAPLTFALLLLAGFLSQWLAWRVKLPAILFLLLTGIVLGPVLGWVDPDEGLGELLFPFVSLGVAVILFEGSLTLRFEQLRGLGSSVLNLVSIGALITLGGLAFAAHTLAGLDWPLALLFGAICCVTGPTVILPMLRSVRPNARVANVLRWEGIVIDPIGALLAVLVFEAVALGHGDDGLKLFAITVVLGSLIGVVAAFALAFLLRRHWVPEYLQNYATLAMVLLAFAASNAAAEESGLLAVTVMGMVLANHRGLHIDDILDFKENLSTLLISMLFIVLAARLTWPSAQVLIAGMLVLGAAMLVVRPVSVLVSTLGSSLDWRERALIAWIAPRGIVAASISALFALRLEEVGVEGADTLVPLTFLLIIGTVLIQSATARSIARWLKVADPDPRGVLIVGASRIARLIAESLKKQKFDVLIADDDWWGVRAARMAELRAYFGNPVSEHADRHLDLIGIGRLLALSTRRELNTLACVRFRPEFGKDKVYYLRNVTAEEAKGRSDFSQPLRARVLFGDNITHGKLDEMVEAGWSLKTTKFTDSFTLQDFVGQYEEPPLLLYAVNERGALRFATTDLKLEPRTGWSLTALVNPATRRKEPEQPTDTEDATRQEARRIQASAREVTAEASGDDASPAGKLP